MKIPIYVKLVAGFGIVILLMALIQGFVLVELGGVSRSVRNILTSDVRTIDVTRQLFPLLDDEERYGQKFLVARDSTYATLFSETARQFTITLEAASGSVRESDERAMVERIAREHRALVAALFADTSGAVAPADVVVTEHINALRLDCDALIRMNQTTVTREMASLERSTNRTGDVALIWMIAGTVVALIAAWLITQSVTRPLSLLRLGAERVGRGEFGSVTVRSHDEIGTLAESFNRMSAQLKAMHEYKAEVMQQISHELRMPLQSMHSAYYLLAEGIRGPLTDGQRKLLQTMRDNMERIALFSNQFLDLSKIEAGMMPFQRVVTDLASLIQPAVDNARVVAAAKKVTLEVSTVDVPLVTVDPERLSQVVVNLLSNALKFTPSGGTVTLTLEPGGRGVRLCVADTGIGIDPEDVPRLFTKFFQAKSAATIGVKGTGVGLALVKAIVESHGGDRVRVQHP